MKYLKRKLSSCAREPNIKTENLCFHTHTNETQRVQKFSVSNTVQHFGPSEYKFQI